MTDDRLEPPASAHADDGAALAALLRTVLRDVAHELRGPVQSVVVNLEVLRRRAASGQTDDVLSRADVIEQEVRRLHGLADAFLGLLREPAAEPVTLSVQKLLASADPIIDVVARTSRVNFERLSVPADILVHVRPEPAILAVLGASVASIHAAGAGGTVHVTGSADAHAFVLELVVGRDATGGLDASVIDSIRPALDAWLTLAGGTATLDAGSDTGRARAVIKLNRAT